MYLTRKKSNKLNLLLLSYKITLSIKSLGQVSNIYIYIYIYKIYFYSARMHQTDQNYNKDIYNITKDFLIDFK